MSGRDPVIEEKEMHRGLSQARFCWRSVEKGTGRFDDGMTMLDLRLSMPGAVLESSGTFYHSYRRGVSLRTTQEELL